MRPTGGRGKVATTYKSTHVRIPDAIKHRVEQLKDQYFDGSLEYADELIAENHKLANEYRKMLTGNIQSSQSENSLKKLENELASLKTENEQLKLQLVNAKIAKIELHSQLAEANLLVTEWQQKKELLRALLEKVNNNQKGYKSNSFSKGLKELAELIEIQAENVE